LVFRPVLVMADGQESFASPFHTIDILVRVNVSDVSHVISFALQKANHGKFHCRWRAMVEKIARADSVPSKLIRIVHRRYVEGIAQRRTSVGAVERDARDGQIMANRIETCS